MNERLLDKKIAPDEAAILRFWSKIARSGLAQNVEGLFLYMIVLVASVAM